MGSAVTDRAESDTFRETGYGLVFGALAEKEDTMAFHSINGWYFERMEDGGVRITKTDQRPDHRGELIVGVELPAETWCSAVASVSAKGENADTFAGATQLHDGQGYSPSV